MNNTPPQTEETEIEARQRLGEKPFDAALIYEADAPKCKHGYIFCKECEHGIGKLEDTQDSGVCYEHGRIMLHNGKCHDCRNRERKSTQDSGWEVSFRGMFGNDTHHNEWAYCFTKHGDNLPDYQKVLDFIRTEKAKSYEVGFHFGTERDISQNNEMREVGFNQAIDKVVREISLEKKYFQNNLVPLPYI